MVVLAVVIVILVVYFARSQEPKIPGLVSTSVGSDEPTILENNSGAKIVVPALESSGGLTVSIREVAPPVSHVSVGEVFDFSITDEAGQDVSFDQPVAITLPYSLPEGREHSDVVVLHWNETKDKWEPVEGGDVDQAAQTITVQVSHLSTFGISWLLSFAEFLADSAETLIGATFGQHYEQGNKHLLALKATGGTHKVNGDVSLIIDVDDLLGITEEGKAGYVTTWLNVTAGLGRISWSNTLPVGIYFFVHDRSDGDDDPRFKAKFKSLSGSATLGGNVVGLEALTVTNGKINPASGSYQLCLTCTEVSQAVSLSWADLTWNASRAELRLRPDDRMFETLKGRLKAFDDSTEEIPAEEFASEVIGSTFEVIGDQITAIFDEPSAPFTSYDQPSPEVAIDWYGSLQNQIVGHCGGENNFGPSSRLCSEGDMIFPSHTDSSGSPVVETPLRLSVKGDARETRDYFIKVVDISPGWEIKVARDSNLWTTLVTLLLYDDRAQFEARAGGYHFIPFLVGNTSFAPNPGVATFELVHVKGFADDEVLDLYRVELWQGREVSDLSVTATPNSVEAISGASATLLANVANRGPNRIEQVALHIDVPENGNLLLSSASTPTGLNPCRTLYFGKLLCELGALNSNQSVTVELDFSLSGSGSPVEGDNVHLQVSSTVYDPQSDNNLATATILISPSTTLPTQPQPRPPIVQPPPPTGTSDREVLIALYGATRGEYWYNNRNGIEAWEVDKENSDISSWHGVTVSSVGRVTELYLYSNDLRYDRDHRNSLPPELGNLAYLEWLDLSGNDLRGRLPDAFGNLRNLVELHLNNNSLSGNIPASLGNLANLESLDLSENNLSGEIPAGLGYLPRMDVVYLGGNNLSGCIPAEWRRVQGDLYELDLPFCDVALNDLTISPGQLSPEFEVGESRYTAEVAGYETTITPANYQGASFQFLDAGGDVLVDADAARPGHQVHLTAATTAVTIRVTSRNGGEDGSYTIEISRSPGAPGAPVMNPATPMPSTLTLSWSAPSNTGTSPISSYSLRYRVAGPGGGALAPWTVVQNAWNPSRGSLSHDLTRLQPSVRYELQMRAVNNSGPGPWSAPVTGTTVSALPPGMPLNLTAATLELTEIRLSWQQPASDGGSPIAGYRIQASQDGATWDNLAASAHPEVLTYSHTALSAGSTWHYRVAAINSSGLGPWSKVAMASTESPVTPQLPGPPVNPAAMAEGTTVIRLSWGPPASTGSGVVSGYQLEVSEDGKRWSPLAAVGPRTMSYNHTGLSPQSARWYRVAASNNVGLGDWSVVFSATADAEPEPRPVDSEPSEGDRAALVAFYHATSGPYWTRSENWLSGVPLGQWHGIETNDVGRVTAITLVDSSLTGRIPAELGNLSELQRLELSGNLFSGPVPSELGRLVKLQGLILNDNRLSGPIPAELGMLVELMWLQIAGNQLTGCVPERWSRIPNNDVSKAGLDFCQPSSTTSLGSPEGDRIALVALYNSTGGSSWANNDNWLSVAPLAEWYGVTTDVNGRVTEVKLSENRLTGRIPPELGRLSNLLVLELGNRSYICVHGSGCTSESPLANRLTGTIPYELSNLKGLVGLDLQANQLTGSVPAWLGELSNLRWLILSANPLSGSIPAELGGLRDMEILLLNNDGLSGPVPDWLGNLTNLTRLDIRGFGITGQIPVGLTNLTKLEWLVLGGGLTGSLPSGIGNLTSLQHLSIGVNRLKGPIPSSIGRLVNLEVLLLNNNELTGRIPSSLGDLDKMRFLTLAGNSFTGCIPGPLRNVETSDLDQLGLPYCNLQ